MGVPDQSLPANNSLSPKMPAKARLKPMLIETIAALFWAYVLVTVLIFNFDAFVAAKMGEYGWVISLKPIILLGVVVVVAWTTSLIGTIKTLLYILSWPLLKIVWSLPKTLVRIGSWSLALGLLSATASFFYKFRQNITLIFGLFVCQTLPHLVDNTHALVAIAIANLLILLWLYVRATLSIFQPNILFAAYRFVIQKSTGFVVKHTRLDAEIKQTPVSKLETAQITKRSENLAHALLFGRACAFVARKLPALHSKGYATAAGAMSIFSLILFTTIVFTTVNFSIYKALPKAFETAATPSFFKFGYYSFFSFLNRDIKDIIPVSSLAQAVSVIEAIFALFLVLVFAASLISYRTEKYSAQLADTANTIELQSKEIETYVADEWSLSIDEAFKELERAKSGLLTILIWLSKK